mgnify:CR=1 FL=1
MRKIYSMLALLASTALTALAGLQTPTISQATMYAGSSFVANWGGTNSDKYLLSVYTLGDEVTKVDEDFSKVNQADGKLDTTNPGIPAGWTVDVAARGTTDVIYDGKKNRILLDANNDKVVTPILVGGTMRNCVFRANIVNANGIVKDNSSVFVVNVYDKEGDLVQSGRIEAIYFAVQQDFNLAEAFGYELANVGRVEFMIEKSEGHDVGDIAISSISYEFKSPKYVMTDQAVTGVRYTVTGLDPEAVYYYYVKAQEGTEVSDMSGIMLVDGFLSVTALPASNVTANSFTANWEYLPKSTGYILQGYRYDVAKASGVREVLKENFSKSTKGTVALPITYVADADALTDCPGWSGRNLIAAAGMMGANSGRFPVNMSYVHSPEMNLSASKGVYAVHVKAHGTAGDQLSVYHVGYVVNGALVMHKLTFDANGEAEDTWEMEDGDGQTVLSFEESKMKPFLLDVVEVTQKISAGDVSTVVLPEVRITDSKATSYDFTDLVPDTRYAYTVTGWRTDEYKNENASATSDYVYVSLGTAAGISNGTVSAGKPQVSVSGNTVTVTLAKAAPIYLIGVDGSTRQVVAGHAGANTLTVAAGQVYIVKAGGYAFKFVAQ